MSSRPCHLAGGGRSALARIVKDSTRTLGSPVLVRNMRAVHADEIGEVEVFEDGVLLIAQHLFLGVDLDSSALVLEVEELALAHVAMGGDASGQSDSGALGQLTRLELRPRLAAAGGGGELVAERVQALGAQSGQFRPTLLDQCVGVFHRAVRVSCGLIVLPSKWVASAGSSLRDWAAARPH